MDRPAGTQPPLDVFLQIHLWQDDTQMYTYIENTDIHTRNIYIDMHMNIFNRWKPSPNNINCHVSLIGASVEDHIIQYSTYI